MPSPARLPAPAQPRCWSVGARPRGHASSVTLASRNTSAYCASVESRSPAIATTGSPSRFATFRTCRTSAVSPLLDIARTKSSRAQQAAIPVQSIRGMHKYRRRTGAAEGCRNFFADDSGLAQPCHGDFAGARRRQIDGAQKGLAQALRRDSGSLPLPLPERGSQLPTMDERQSRSPFPPQRAANPQNVFHETRKIFQIQSIGSVRQSFRGIVMHFKKETVDAGRRSRAGKIRNKLRISAGTVSLAAGHLHAVCDIENHRLAEGPQDQK